MWLANAVSSVPVETPESARTVDSFSIDAQTTGAKSANLFTGFTNSALNIINGQSGFGGTGHKYAKAADGSATFVSTYACMDSEVTARMGPGMVGLRYDGATGTALVLYIPGNSGLLTVEARSGVSLSQTFNVSSGYAVTVDLAAFGWTATSEADTYTFGAVGFNCYLKWNGVTVKTWQDLSQPVAGKCFVWGASAYDGVSDTSITYLPATMLGSNRAKKLFDLRDFGVLKNTLTTGSMSAGSNQLTVASASGFAIGDPIIVEIGGEAGAGQRGTKGVGGACPTTSYATTSALLAATPANNTWAWAEDTGLVYTYQSGVWGQNFYTTALYTTKYTEKALPRALKATITGIAGNVLTLNATATVATTNARVHFDNANAFAPLTTNLPTAPYGVTVKLPTGDYALASQMTIHSSRNGWTFAGAGKTASKLFTPKGLVPVQISNSQSSYLTIKDMAWEGSHKLGSDGMPYSYQMGTSDPTGPEDYPISFSGSLTTGMILSDIAISNVWRAAIAFSGGLNNRANRCTLYMEAPVVGYTQWFFSSNSSSVGDEFHDCEVLYCPSLIKSFECFAGSNAKFINCGGYNVLCSSNSAGGVVYDSFHSDIYANSFYQLNAGYPGEPVINVNHNAYPDSPLNQIGGQIINPRIIQHAKINYLAGGSATAIKVQSGISNWTITGAYGSDTTPFVATKGGYLEAPDYVSGDYGEGAVGVLIDGDSCAVSGVRSVGASSNRLSGGITWGNFVLRGAGDAATSNIGDVFSFGAATSLIKSGNRTNAGVSVP